MEKYLETHDLNLPQGSIRGAKRKTIYEVPYYSFEGIPFGKPPIGELRFKAPQPAEPWSGILDCTMFRSKPIQIIGVGAPLEGAEDCLFLNVYAKKLDSVRPLPVMVWIYGGGFYSGEATRERFSPDYIMNEEMILVTFNYRVGALGFLSLEDPELEVPGNAGLKDQILALKWVKQYISHFNGDSENITLFGESAGSVAAHLITLSEQTRGLFQRVILMSGCALNFWGIQPHTDIAYRLAKHNGYTGKNIDKDVLAYLRTLKPEQLVEDSLLNKEEVRSAHFFCFVPTVEPYVGKDCVVPTEPFKMLKTTWSNSIPMMIGANSNEGLFLYPRMKAVPQFLSSIEFEPERLVPTEVRKRNTDKEIDALTEKMLDLHFLDTKLTKQATMNFLNYFSFRVTWHSVQRAFLARLEYAPNVPTYLYRFAFDSPNFNFYRKILCGKDQMRGAAHGDELSYLFFFKEAWKLEPDSNEFKTIQRMVALWTSFAKNSDPNCEILKPLKWNPLQKSNPYQALNISNALRIADIPEKAKLLVWNTMYKEGDLY